MATAYLENDAVISDCGKYRYLLRRTWDHGKPRALLVMLNPSTADATIDDADVYLSLGLIGDARSLVEDMLARVPHHPRLMDKLDEIAQRELDVEGRRGANLQHDAGLRERPEALQDRLELVGTERQVRRHLEPDAQLRRRLEPAGIEPGRRRRELLGQFGVVQRLLFDHRNDLGCQLIHGIGCDGRDRICLALDVVVDLGAVGVGIGDGLEALFGNALADGGIDADLRAHRHLAVRHDRQRRIERLGACARDDHHIAITLHPRGDGP